MVFVSFVIRFSSSPSNELGSWRWRWRLVLHSRLSRRKLRMAGCFITSRISDRPAQIARAIPTYWQSSRGLGWRLGERLGYVGLVAEGAVQAEAVHHRVQPRHEHLGSAGQMGVGFDSQMMEWADSCCPIFEPDPSLTLHRDSWDVSLRPATSSAALICAREDAG